MTRSQVNEIRILLMAGYSVEETAELVGETTLTVEMIEDELEGTDNES